MSSNMDAPDSVLDKIAKLIKLASKNPSPEEAASAMAKAQKLMDEWNLTTSTVEKHSGKREGKREEQQVEGGFYAFQRSLWSAVARMNFCIYFNEFYRGEVERTYARYDDRTGRTRHYNKGDVRWKSRHRIVGRAHNVAATKAMATYLLQSVTHVLRKRVTKSDGTIGPGVMMDSWAVSFREGACANLISRLEAERRKAETKREAEAKRTAKMAGHSTATALTIADVAKTEYAANYDFLYGDGAYAKVLAEKEEAAREERREREEMARLATENSEEFRRREEERRKAVRASSGGGSRSERPRDWSAFNAGHDAADAISLSQQVDEAKDLKRIGR